MITFANPLVFVSDIDRSTDFYRNLLGCEPIERHHDFVLFPGGFAIHDGAELLKSIYPDRQQQPAGSWGRDNLGLYFESDDLERDHERLAATHDVIHPLRREPWGGRIFRLYDPDGHVIEIGERQPA